MEANGNNTGATLLQKRKKQVKVKKEETLLILRAYISHPTNWSDILEEVRHNINRLPEEARDLYRNNSAKQLKTRMSGKLGGLISKRHADIEDLDIREELEAVQRLERRHQVPGAAEVRQPQNGPDPAVQNEMENPAQQAHADAQPPHGPAPLLQNGRGNHVQRARVANAMS